jgi:hypothetical protein
VEALQEGQGRFKRLGIVAPGTELSQYPVNSFSSITDPGEPRRITLEEADMQRPEDDRDDPLGFAKRFGITAEHILKLDKEVRMCRWNPNSESALVENIRELEERLRTENRLGARGIAKVLYKNGARAIWILPRGGIFYGPEVDYLQRMQRTSVAEAIERITLE